MKWLILRPEEGCNNAREQQPINFDRTQKVRTNIKVTTDESRRWATRENSSDSTAYSVIRGVHSQQWLVRRVNRGIDICTYESEGDSTCLQPSPARSIGNAGGVGCRHHAVLLENWAKPCHLLSRCVRAWVFVLVHHLFGVRPV